MLCHVDDDRQKEMSQDLSTFVPQSLTPAFFASATLRRTHLQQLLVSGAAEGFLRGQALLRHSGRAVACIRRPLQFLGRSHTTTLPRGSSHIALPEVLSEPQMQRRRLQ